ncbi:MAG: S9 family peptidase [Pseudoflavonifractor sp.]|nr:S9 family peptidase [Pseudoflavonifractor sp.]
MRILRYILPGVVTLMLATVAGNAYALSQDTQSELSRYCYPENIPSSPGRIVYMPDGKSYLRLSSDKKRILSYDTRTGIETGVILDVATTRYNMIDAIEGFSMSADGTKLLVYKDSRTMYRHSFRASYYVFEINRNILKPLSESHPVQQVPAFSPDSRMVAFVADNNIYIKKLDYETEVAVTTDGRENEIINGVPDWVYQEEFSTVSSIAWAPDNSTLCFLKYNESAVPMYSLTMYEGACDPMTRYALYPGQFSYKYPVAGEPNSKVSLHSYDVETRKTKDISLPDTSIEYIPRISYAGSPERLAVVALNRAQNRMELYAVNPKSTVARSVYTDENSSGWIAPEMYAMARFYPDFFVVASERSGYSNLYQYSYTGSLMRQLTTGEDVVTAYYGYDAAKGLHYYQSTAGPLNRVVRSVDAKGRVSELSQAEGTSTATFDPLMTCYTLSYSNVDTPPVYTLYTVDHKKVRVVEDNTDYASRYKSAPRKEFFTMTSDGYTLNGYIIKPSDFNPSDKYPVIMYQYSGPGSQTVLNRWSMDWEQFYATQGYIVACVDGRGTGGRGRAFEDIVYRNLGKYETIDQIAAAHYMASLPYVDSSRIGIHGWSYGGYETLMAVSQSDSPYAAAVAVAPVTSWRYYDTIYTERFMLTPNENESGYNDGAPINLVDNMRCPLLIMTGTADDNVHPANTIEYVSHLLAAGTTCDMLLFPNMNHSINYCNGRLMVYAKMLDYFNEKLNNK